MIPPPDASPTRNIKVIPPGLVVRPAGTGRKKEKFLQESSPEKYFLRNQTRQISGVTLPPR